MNRWCCWNMCVQRMTTDSIWNSYEPSSIRRLKCFIKQIDQQCKLTSCMLSIAAESYYILSIIHMHKSCPYSWKPATKFELLMSFGWGAQCNPWKRWFARTARFVQCYTIWTGFAQLIRRRTRVLAIRVRSQEAGHYRVRLDNRSGRISNRKDCNW